MKLAIDIDGREAIPVRALPWITGWHFGAHEVAEALSGDGNESRTPFTTAYWLDGGGAKHAIPKDHWVMTSQRLEQAEDAGLINQDWHAIATGLLPEGVWVWRDEWATAYNDSPDGPGQMELIAETPEDWQDVASRRIQLAPFVPPELRGEILAGFDRLAESEGGADAAELLKPVTDAAGHEAKPGTGKRWTTEFLAEVKAYREKHTEKDTATKFGVSGTLVRRKLADEKPKASLFSGLVKVKR